jgi:hypothetical protein
VALMIPHIARMIAGADVGQRAAVYRQCWVRSSCWCRTWSASTILPVTLPVGVVTAAVGAPYFLYPDVPLGQTEHVTRAISCQYAASHGATGRLARIDMVPGGTRPR